MSTVDPESEHRRILVVEDERLVRDMVVLDLREAGFDVIEAENAERALEQLDRYPEIRVLFTDIRLGGELDGWDLAERVRRRLPDVDVVYATAFAGGETRPVEGGRLIKKPFRSRAVLSLFSELGVNP